MLRYNQAKIIPFDKSFASHSRASEWSNKNDLKPHDVALQSNKDFIFDCKTCHHEYKMRLNNIISRNSECGFCTSKYLCSDDNCEMCKEKSFASEPLSKTWSPKNEISARNVFKSSNKQVYFICDVCNHEYKAFVNNITRNGSGCPYCGNHQLCNDINCEICLKKSFASYPDAHLWSDKNNVSPRNVFKSAIAKYLFNCNVCKHVYEMSIDAFTGKKTRCTFCGNKWLCDDINCVLCQERSFASHPKSKYWSSKNKVSPRDVFKNSGKKYLFDCPECNEIYEVSLDTVVKGHWCSCTKNKTEAKLLKFLKAIPNITIIKQKPFEWCQNKRCLPFDFFIESHNLIIELDGGQHFFQVSNWQSPEKCQKLDKYKMKLANKHGYSVIRIYQLDVWKDKNDWKTKLTDAIKKYPKPTNIFIGDIYNDFH